MADSRFFKKSSSFSVKDLAEKLSCDIGGKQNSDLVLQDVSPLHLAESHHLSFLDNVKYKSDFATTKAGACFVSPDMVEFAPKDVTCLITKSPYKCYALAAQLFYPETPPESKIESSAKISPSAKIGKHAYIGHNVVIKDDAEIGDYCWLEANSVIGCGVKIGNYFRLGVNANVSHAIIGDYVRLYCGARIGQDGFGFAIDPAGHVKVPQLGRVIIEDHVEIGANTTIDRGSGPDTIIGQGSWIDNLVQIGHNVQIGRGCVIVAQVGISGSTQIGDYVVMGGQVGIAGHLKIGSGARIGAQSGIMKDIPAGAEYMGSPAFPKTQYFKQVAALNRLIKPSKRD